MGKIEIIDDGKNNILLIAPHGHPKNDMNTGELARRIAEKLGCYAVINEYYRRPFTDKSTGKRYKTDKKQGIVNLNNIRGIKLAKMEAEFLQPIFDIKEKILSDGANKEVLLILIHGLGDDDEETTKVTNNEPSVIIGCGKGKPDRLSVKNMAVVENFKKIISENKKHRMASCIAGGGEYSGWANHNLNQLFTGFVDEKYKDDRVQSIQLEFKFTGSRDADSLDKTADVLSTALSEVAGLKGEVLLLLPEETVVPEPEQKELLESVKGITTHAEGQHSEKKELVAIAQIVSSPVESKPDEVLVEQSLIDLKNIFIKEYEVARGQAMLKAGRYLIDTFYEGNYEFAKSKKKAIKKKSLNLLIRKLHEHSNNAPSKTWIYDAIALAVDDRQLSAFRTYGKISVSHKLKLLTESNLDKKRLFIEEIVKKNLSVRGLSARMKADAVQDIPIETKEIDAAILELFENISIPEKLFAEGSENQFSDQAIIALESEQRVAIKKGVSSEIKKLEKYLEKYKKLEGKLKKFIQADRTGKRLAGFDDSKNQ